MVFRQFNKTPVPVQNFPVHLRIREAISLVKHDITFKREPMPKQAFLTLLLILTSAITNAQQPVNRKDLLSAAVANQTIDNVQAKEITMNPGQRAPRHQHACPVVGYVVKGTIIYQIEGGPAKTLNEGEAFFEPANKVITHFDNASVETPAKFIAFYLRNGEQPLVEVLPEPK